MSLPPTMPLPPARLDRLKAHLDEVSRITMNYSQPEQINWILYLLQRLDVLYSHRHTIPFRPLLHELHRHIGARLQTGSW